ncbi:hypothetical protein ACFDTO_22595 [Microbacteriaceae bacterium 4G12]
MKLRSSFIIPVLAASLLAPAAGSALASNKADATSKSAATQHKDHKGAHQKGEKQQELTNIINQYASPELKAQLTKDLATRESLMKQLRQTKGSKKQEGQEKAEHKAAYQAHKQQIDAIRQQVKDGKLTKQQAHEQMAALFGKQEKGKEEKGKDAKGEQGIRKELKAAVKKKDTAAINAALQKLDQQLQSANQKLQQKIGANK